MSWMEPQLFLHIGEGAREKFASETLRCRNVSNEESGVELDASITICHDAFLSTCARRRTRKIQIFWIDYENRIQSYGEVSAGSRVQIRTYVGHSFVLKYCKTIILSFTVPRAQEYEIRIFSLNPTKAIANITHPSLVVEPQINDSVIKATSKDVNAGESSQTDIELENGSLESLCIRTVDENISTKKVIITVSPSEHTEFKAKIGEIICIEPSQTLTDRKTNKSKTKNFLLVVPQRSLPTAIRITSVSPKVHFRVEPSEKEVILCKTEYEEIQIEGFTFHVEKGLQESNPELKDAIREDIDHIIKSIPPDALNIICRVHTWINGHICFGRRRLSMKWSGCCYHPSKDWLTSNGNMHEKEKGVEIYRVKDYLSSRNGHLASTLIHEFAHAFHDRIGFDRCDINTAYDSAMIKKKYAFVAHTSGQERKAYAATNPKEYFAELSVAYFSRCNYYPFTRDDLFEYDTEGYQLVSKLWGLSGDTLKNELQSFAM